MCDPRNQIAPQPVAGKYAKGSLPTAEEAAARRSAAQPKKMLNAAVEVGKAVFNPGVIGPLDINPASKAPFYDERLKELKLSALDRQIETIFQMRDRAVMRRSKSTAYDRLGTPFYNYNNRQVKGLNAKLDRLYREAGAISRNDQGYSGRDINTNRKMGLNNPSPIDSLLRLASMFSSNKNGTE